MVEFKMLCSPATPAIVTLINVTSTVRTVLDRLIKFYVTCIFFDFVTKVGLGKVFLFLNYIEPPGETLLGS